MPDEPTTMPLKVSQVPIVAAAAPYPPAGLSPVERREHCRVSADVAAELGAATALEAGRRIRVRISVTAADVNLLFNPDCVDSLGRAAGFTVGGIATGSHRVEVYPSSSPSARDGGVYRLFGSPGHPFAGKSIPTNARVTLERLEDEPRPAAKAVLAKTG